ncbi:MAG: hypothetical protein JXR22_13545 [Prolixibacteraceae bacterium]|nr:hypothetical protein [Prolixibacteraceae bacterium]
MKRSKIIRIGLIAVLAAIVLGGATGYYLFNMPHRDVHSAKTDYQLTASALVTEYLENADAANEKYLAANGDSKILEVTGVVHKITEDFAGNKVIILKNASDKAGVSCTFNGEIGSLSLGASVTVKGVINAGASYDADMELYQDVVLNNCTLVN